MKPMIDCKCPPAPVLTGHLRHMGGRSPQGEPQALEAITIDEIREIFDEVRKDIWGAVESRKLQLPIDKVFSFDDIGKAFEHMEANKHLGKIVVTL